MSYHGMLEDAEGYFCNRCGRGTCDETTCREITSIVDVEWDVALATLENSLEITEVQDYDKKPLFSYNSRTRERAIKKLKEYLSDFWYAERLRHGREP